MQKDTLLWDIKFIISYLIILLKAEKNPSLTKLIIRNDETRLEVIVIQNAKKIYDSDGLVKE